MEKLLVIYVRIFMILESNTLKILLSTVRKSG